VGHLDKISPGATPRSTSVLLDFHTKKLSEQIPAGHLHPKVSEPGPVLSTLAGAQVFNSLNMSRITGISDCYWDHCATQKTTTGTAAAGTGDTARDRDMAMKAGSCQL